MKGCIKRFIPSGIEPGPLAWQASSKVTELLGLS